MNVVPLIVAFFVQLSPIVPVQLDRVTLAGGISAVENHVGGGKLLEDGDKITIQYRVWDSNYKVLADSQLRGMPFTMVVGQRNSDPLLTVALSGMHAGGIRTADIPADAIPIGIGSIVPPKTDLHLWIYVIAAKAIKNPKVEFSHAERAQGAVEIPRAPTSNGSARTKDSL